MNGSEAVKIGQETTSKGPAQLVRNRVSFNYCTCYMYNALAHAHRVSSLIVSLYEATKALIYYVNLIISSKNNLCYEV